MQTTTTSATREIVKLIYQALNLRRKNPYQLAYSSYEINKVLSKIIEQQLAIKLVLPAFHGKSPNNNLVLANQPDYGEYLAIATLAKLYHDLSQIYPRLEIILFHHGHLYADIKLAGDDNAVAIYLQKLRELLKPYPFIHSRCSNELLSASGYNDQREQFMNRYCPSAEQVRQLISQNDLYYARYKSYVKFYELHNFEDFEKLKNSGCDLPLSEKNNPAKYLARIHLAKHLGFSRLLQEYFAETPYVRLSQVYKDNRVKDQVAINLLEGNHDFGVTPFNTVVKRKNHNYTFSTSSDALKKGHQLIIKENLALYLEG